MWVNWGLWLKDEQCCREVTNEDGSVDNAPYYDDADTKVKGMRTYIDSTSGTDHPGKNVIINWPPGYEPVASYG